MNEPHSICEQAQQQRKELLELVCLECLDLAIWEYETNDAQS
jgi:hypothetical protein